MLCFSGTVYLYGSWYKLASNSTREIIYLIPTSLENNATLDYTCGKFSEHFNFWYPVFYFCFTLFYADVLRKYSTQTGLRSKRSTHYPLYYKNYVNWKELYVELAIVFDNSAVSMLGYT